MKRLLPIAVALALSAAGCSSDSSDGSGKEPVTSCATGDDECYRGLVARRMHDLMLGDIQTLHDEAVAIQKAAPEGHGWDADGDASAIGKMREAWIGARTAYERTEGAIAPLFSEIDAAIDERYDGFLEDGGGDDDLFDGKGVTGMHAIERILYAHEISSRVIEVESSLPGYEAAAWPATAEEAKSFKTELCQKLIDDTQELIDQWTPQNIDAEGAYNGLTALMNEQKEKVVKASSGEEESRYSQRTMTDIRDNLAGTRAAYALFEKWLDGKGEGKQINEDIHAAFDELEAAYDAVDGEAIPTPPATWSAEDPSEADLATPFGKLYTAVFAAIDPSKRSSVVGGMERAGSALGFVEAEVE